MKYHIVPNKALRIIDMNNGDVLNTLDGSETLKVVCLAIASDAFAVHVNMTNGMIALRGSHASPCAHATSGTECLLHAGRLHIH